MIAPSKACSGRREPTAFGGLIYAQAKTTLAHQQVTQPVGRAGGEKASWLAWAALGGTVGGRLRGDVVGVAPANTRWCAPISCRLLVGVSPTMVAANLPADRRPRSRLPVLPGDRLQSTRMFRCEVYPATELEIMVRCIVPIRAVTVKGVCRLCPVL